MKILWLTSWYPNKYELVNGDFIQRHAIAVSKKIDIEVIHVAQLGKDLSNENYYECFTSNGFKEHIYSFRYKKIGLSIIDKIRYNIQYKQFYKSILEKYIALNGKPNLVHVHVPMKAGLMALYLKDKFNIPFIVSEQASYYEIECPDNFFNRSLFFRKSTQKIFQAADAATNVSNTIAIKIQKLFKVKKISPVYNLANKEQFFYKPKEEKNEVFKWVHVSTLGEQKNIPGILYAFKNLLQSGIDNWHLTLVGLYYKQHEALVHELQLQNYISNTGELLHKDVVKELQKADAFVMFSNHENFPCVIPEALCCGLPVVGSNAGGVEEAINSTNGFVVHKKDIKALQMAIENVMKNYRNYDRKAIAEDAYKKYDGSVIADSFIKVYNDVLKTSLIQ